MTQIPDIDDLRNKFERKEKELLDMVRQYLNVQAELALEELVIHYRGELERRDNLFRLAIEGKT